MKIISDAMIDDLLVRAAGSPSGRMNLNLHENLADPINRFINAGIAGTYVRPHRHRPDKWELVSILRGRADVVTFADDCAIIGLHPLDATTSPVVEIPGACWHTLIFAAPSAAILEIKPGPYDASADKEFASLAPAEGSPDAIGFLRGLIARLAGLS